MPKPPHFLYFVTLFMGLLLWQSCIKDDFDKRSKGTWSPELAFPLVYADLGPEQLFLDGTDGAQLQAGSNQVVEVVYHALNSTLRTAEYLTLPEPLMQLNPSPSAAFINTFNQNIGQGQTLSDSASAVFSYSLDALINTASQLDTVWLDGGKLQVDVQHNFPHPVLARIEIPELLLNGVPFSQNISLAASNPTGTILRNLNYGMLIPNSESLHLKVIYAVTRNGLANLSSSQNIQVQARFLDPDYQQISGNFGGLNLPMANPDTLILHVFRNTIDALALDFAQSSARIEIRNHTGMATNVTVTDFQTVRPGASSPQCNPSSYQIPTALAAGQSQTFELTANNNSGIREAVNAQPRFAITRFQYQFNSGTHHRLRDTSRISVYSEIRLPMQGLSLQLALRDTFAFDFSSITSEIREGSLRLYTQNGYPAGGAMQVYFVKRYWNAQGQISALQRIDSLLLNPSLVLESGLIDGNGQVVQPRNRTTDAPISPQRWKAIKDAGADALEVKAWFTTFNQGNSLVRILESNRLKAHLGARIKVQAAW